MDFVSDSYGRRIKRLTVADDFSRERVDTAMVYGIDGWYATTPTDAERLYRELQWQVSGRMPLRALVRNPAVGQAHV